MRPGFDARSLAFLAVGHVFNDVNQSAIPALLPFLIAERGLSYASASVLVLAATVVSSVLQPLLGAFSDRRPASWLIPAGILTGGVGIALTGLASTYALAVACGFVSGVGVAAFHPESTRFANFVSGDRRATGMSVFSVGGNLGFALGPVAITACVLAFGMRGSLLMAIPPAVAAVFLWRELPRLETFRPRSGGSGGAGALPPPAWNAFVRLAGVVVLRSLLYFGLLTFVPLYAISARGATVAQANGALTGMLVAGAAATLVGGRLADHVGRKAVLVGSLAPIAPLVLLYMSTRGATAVALLAVLGAAAIASHSVAVVMAQEYLPGREGIASGVTLGLGIGLGGLGVPVFGLVADHQGVAAALRLLCVLPVAGAVLAATLPPASGEERRQPIS